MSEITEDIVKKRIVLNFNQETFTLPKVVATLKSLKEGGTNIEGVILDGLDFSKVETKDLKAFADFIKAQKMTAWFSATSEAATLKDTLDADKVELFATIAHLAADGKELSLNVLKNGEGKVKIDAKTMLMAK